MSEYNDTWSALDTPAAQSDKLKHYNLIMDHLDELNLTDGEKYALGWGHEAVPEDWAKQQAQAIQDRINGMESLNIVKNSRKAAAEPVKDGEESDGKSSSSTSSGGSSSDGGGGDGPASSPGTTDTWGVDPSNTFGSKYGYDAKTGIKGALATMSPIGLVAGITRTTDYNSMTPETLATLNAMTANEKARLDARMAVEDVPDVSVSGDDVDVARAGFGIDAGMGVADSSSGLNGTGRGGGYGDSPGEGTRGSPGSNSDSGSGASGGDSGGPAGVGGNDNGSNSAGGDGDCVDPDARVLMADGSSKRAGDLAPGDMVLAMHENTFLFGPYRVSAADVVRRPTVTMTFAGLKQIVVSEAHRFLVRGNVWKRVSEMQQGDVVRGMSSEHAVLRIDAMGDGDVMRIGVDDAHTYIAEGLISHNKYYRGGKVTQDGLSGPNPPGPDDGFSSLKLGEFVVNDRSVAHYGEDVMQAINQGRIPVQALRRLIGK